MSNLDADAESPLSAAAAFALLKAQQRNVSAERGAFVSTIALSWGIAWLLGFLALWLIDGLGAAFGLPLQAAIAIFVVLFVAAIAISTVNGIRSDRGIRGSAGAFVGMVSGLSWAVGMIAIVVLGGALAHNGMSAHLATIFYPCAYTVVVGLLSLVSGGIWHSVSSVVVGGWLVLVAVIAPWFGYPTHYLIIAIAGGGGFFALAAVVAKGGRAARRASEPGTSNQTSETSRA